MPEIILTKRLPNLTPEEEIIFCEAINEAYLRGKADGVKWAKRKVNPRKHKRNAISTETFLAMEKIGQQTHGGANL